MNGFNPLQDLPMGFGMALAQNVRAMEVFSSLSPDEQRRVVDGTHASGPSRRWRPMWTI